MYAVIETGGKQYKVAEGDRLDVERLAGSRQRSDRTGAERGDDQEDEVEVTLRPVLLVDGDAVFSTPSELGGAAVTARVVGEAKGPKIKGYTYKNKSNQRRHWGHRQHYSTIEITGISRG